jgi:hypothetical protein
VSQRALVLALAAVLASGYAATPAHAGGDPTGLGCGLATTNDVTGLVGFVDVQQGTMTAGPVAVPDYAEDPALVDVDLQQLIVDLNPAAGTPASQIEIECSVRLNDPNNYWAAGITSSGSFVATFPATLVAFQATATDTVYVCTKVTWDYWDSYERCDRARRVVEGYSVSFVREPAVLQKVV